MNSKLFTYLKVEEDILIRMIENAEKQRDALVHYEVAKLEILILEQNEYAKSMRNAEELRIRLIMEDTKLPRMNASRLKMSGLVKYAESDEARELTRIKLSLRELLIKLNATNALNRLLTNRALKTTQEMLSIITTKVQPFCNTKV